MNTYYEHLSRESHPNVVLEGSIFRSDEKFFTISMAIGDGHSEGRTFPVHKSNNFKQSRYPVRLNVAGEGTRTYYVSGREITSLFTRVVGLRSLDGHNVFERALKKANRRGVAWWGTRVDRVTNLVYRFSLASLYNRQDSGDRSALFGESSSQQESEEQEILYTPVELQVANAHEMGIFYHSSRDGRRLRKVSTDAMLGKRSSVEKMKGFLLDVAEREGMLLPKETSGGRRTPEAAAKEYETPDSGVVADFDPAQEEPVEMEVREESRELYKETEVFWENPN